jgi:hypothetical protein
MRDSPSACVADANVLIDLHVGGLLPGALTRPFQLVAPDLIIAEMDSPSGLALVAQGLVEESLSATDIRELAQLKTRYPRALSVMDLAALVLAKRMRVILLTGEKLLRGVAEEEGVEVRGTLWLLDQMIASEVLGRSDAAAALESMLAAGRRLPVPECEKRLRMWRGG